MSADKFKQLSEAFLKISQGFADVASIMSSDLEPVGLKRPVMMEEIQPADSTAVATSSAHPPSKKVKKEKDPNAPKRPLNAYFLFQRDYRKKLKSTHPDLGFVELTKMLNEAWEKLGSEKRAMYESESKVLMEAFAKENKAYKEGKEGSGESSPASAAAVTSTNSKTLPESVKVESKPPLPVDTSSSSSEFAESPKKKKKKQKHQENPGSSQ